jgi:hypothetical protein
MNDESIKEAFELFKKEKENKIETFEKEKIIQK